MLIYYLVPTLRMSHCNSMLFLSLWLGPAWSPGRERSAGSTWRRSECACLSVVKTTSAERIIFLFQGFTGQPGNSGVQGTRGDLVSDDYGRILILLAVDCSVCPVGYPRRPRARGPHRRHGTKGNTWRNRFRRIHRISRTSSEFRTIHSAAAMCTI